jgi:LysM repeat protein
LLAVFINAAMLIVLFATALTSQEEIALAPTHEISHVTSPPQNPSPPMFGDELDFILRTQSTKAQDALQQALPEVQMAETAIAKSEVPKIIHSLPSIQSNSVQSNAAVQEMPSTAVVSKMPDRLLDKLPTQTSGLQETHVKKGDTLEKIAKAHHTTVDEIIKLNHLPSSFLRIGQSLKLPAEKTSTAKPAAVEKPTQATGPDYYTVKVGDNPWMIAMKHHLKLEELLKLNGLNEEKARKLKPGDRLRIK